MKIISYNVQDCYPWKIEQLFRNDPDTDVFVVPECTCPEQADIPDGYEMEWYGISYYYQMKRWKGLGIIWKKGHGTVPEWFKRDMFYAIPLIYEGVLVLGFWPTKRRNDKFYPQIAQEMIAEYAQHFKEQPPIIIGDFNCYVNQVDSSKEWGDILRVNNILQSHGLHSVYHSVTGESFGQETTPTYYHNFDIKHPFMLDYAYSGLPEKSFSVRPWDKEISDHCCMELVV